VPLRLGEVFAQRGLALVLLLFFLTFLYMSTLNVALPLLTSLRLSWGEREIGHVFGLFGLMMLVIQGGLIGRMTKVWEPRRIVVGAAISSMLGLFVVAYAEAALPLIGGLAMLAIGLGLINPCLSTIASDQAGPDRQGAVLGVAQSAGGLARTIGPTAAGVVYARIGPGAPFVGGALAALLSVLLALVVPPIVKRDESTSSS
jgi:MFS family permease